MSEETAALKRKVGVALLVPLLALVSCYLAGIIFIVWNWRDLPFFPSPLTFFKYWQQYGHVRALRLSFLVSGGAPAALSTVIFTAALLYKPRPTLYGDGRWSKLPELQKASMVAQSDGVVIGEYKGQIITSHPEHHVELKAPTGSGKGISIVIPNLLLWNGSVVVNDIKGENFEMTSAFRAAAGHKVYVFNPADSQRRTHRWNPFVYVDRDPMLRNKGIQRIAAMLWQPSEDEGEPWKPGARDLFTTIALWHLENDLELTLPKLASFGATLEEDDIKQAVQAREAAGKPYPSSVIEGFVRYFTKPDKYRESVRGEFNKGLEIVTSDPLVSLALSGNDFDIRQFRKQRMTLYVVTPGPDLGRLRPLLNLLWQQIGAENTETEFRQDASNKHQLMFLNDEFTSLGDVAQVVDPIAYYRSYGIKLVTIYQSASQIEGIYGEHRSATFRENHKTRICFTPATKEEAKKISEELPVTTSFSKSKSGRKMERKTHSENESARALLLPDEVALLPQDEVIVLAPGIYPARIKRLTYFERPEFYSRLQAVSPILAKKKKPVREDYDAARQAGQLKIDVPPLPLPAAESPKASNWAKKGGPIFREPTAADIEELAARPLEDFRINGEALPAGPAVDASPEEKREYAASLLASIFGDEDDDGDAIG